MGRSYYSGTDLVRLALDVSTEALRRAEYLSEGQWSEGAAWYALVNAWCVDRADTYGVSVDTVAGIVAALSPRLRWEDNLADADRVLSGSSGACRALRANVAKAERILAGESPEDVLGGRKVRSFYRNILLVRLSLDVTVDVHMWRALVPARYSVGMADPVKVLERAGVYDAVADGIRLAAAVLNVAPLVLQAALWVQERDGSDVGAVPMALAA